MGFSRQEYWSGLPHPPPGDLPDPGIEPMSLTSPAGSLPDKWVIYYQCHSKSCFISTISSLYSWCAVWVQFYLFKWLPMKPTREGNDNPLQYSCLENSMDRGAWWATVHVATESVMTEQLIYTLVIPIAFLSEVHLNGLSWNYALSYSKFSSIFVCFQLSTLFLGLLVCLWAVILSISNLLSGKAMGLQRVGHDLATEQEQKGHSSEFTLLFHCFLSFPHHPTESLLFIFGR